jgi:CRP-like cAMP-binding protein
MVDVAKRNENRTSPSIEANRLLAALPNDELTSLEPHLERVKLTIKECILEADERIEYVHFPRSGVVSAVKEFHNGDVIEVATIGNEGVVGHSVALGVLVSGNRLFVQVPGEAMRIKSSAFLKVMERSSKLHGIMMRYSQALFQQVAQVAACNRAHTVDERCARWLLMTHDRVGNSSFTLTQEFLAMMLGVHRPTVSIAARMLQQAGIITYVRGHITILDRKALEEASCECYGLIQRQYKIALAE